MAANLTCGLNELRQHSLPFIKEKEGMKRQGLIDQNEDKTVFFEVVSQ